MNDQRGLTLLELLITLALGAVLMTTLVNVYLSGIQTNRSLAESATLVEEGQYITSVLAEDLEMAGYFGRLDDYQVARPSAVPNICSGWTPSVTTLAETMALPVMGYNNVATGFSCAGESVKAGTDVLIIARISSVEAVTLENSEFYFQASPVSYVIDVGSNASAFSLTEYDGVTAMAVYPYVLHAYFVDAADDVLKRMVLSGNGYKVEPLIENVEAFQVDYGIDRSGDGAPNSTTASSDDAFVQDPSTLTTWQDVTVVRPSVLIRSSQVLTGHVDTRLYNMGISGVAGPYKDGFKRKLSYHSIKLTNVAMRRQ